MASFGKEKIQKKMAQLSGLAKKQGWNEAQLRDVAIKALNNDVSKKQEAKRAIDAGDLFTDRKEKNLANDMLDRYLRDFTITTVSDQNTMKQVVFLEVVQIRLQKALNKLESESKATPTNLVKTLHDNLREIVNLKEKLGITRDKQQKREKDAYSYLQVIKKKYKVWKEDNQASRYLQCPHCAKAILLKIRTDAWEAQKHPFFKDRILGNAHLISLYKQGKLSREDVATVFQVSNDYVDWLVDKGWGLNIKDPQAESKKATQNPPDKEEKHEDEVSH